VCGVVAAIVTVQAYFDTGGTFDFSAGQGYYEQLGDAFLSGQLYLKTPPSPELLALPNPYDPTANQAYTLHDASLYQGHYYLYFGPFPALIHAALRVATQRPVLDGPVEVASAVVAAVCFWVILERFRRELAPTVRPWLTLLLSLAFGIGGNLLFLVARPAVYHEAVLVAMACMFASLAVLSSTWSTHCLTARSLLVCGVLIGCAVAARVTYLAYAAAIGVTLLTCSVLARRCWRTALPGPALFAAPVLAIGGLLLLYNWARFGSIFETGLSYQLAGPSVAGGVSPMACGSNLRSLFELYFAAFPRLQLHYPWLPFANGPSPSWPVWFPRQWMVPAASVLPIEPPLVSPFVLAPVSLLVVAAPITLLWRPTLGRTLLLAAIPTLGGAVLMVPFLSCANGVDARYFGDVSPALTLLGSLVFVSTVDRAARSSARARISIGIFGALSLAVTLVIGVALGLAAWRYSYNAQADTIGGFTEDWLVNLHLLQPTTYVDTFPDDLRNRGLASSGVYQDGWVQQSSSFTLIQPSNEAMLVVRGTFFDLPVQAGSTQTTELRLFVDGEQVGQQALAASDFNVEAPAPPGLGKRRIDLQFSQIRQLPAPDTRQAAALLRYVGFQAARVPSPSA
jgi:hypothetical protein